MKINLKELDIREENNLNDKIKKMTNFVNINLEYDFNYVEDDDDEKSAANQNI